MIVRLLLLPLLLQGLTAGTRAQQPDTLFEHSRHKSLACLDCHSMSPSHRGPKISAPDGCLGCHHGPAQLATCATCHSSGPASIRAVPVSFRISARRDGLTRQLSFAHTRHSSVDCARCHAAD